MSSTVLRLRWLGRVPFEQGLWLQRAVARESSEQYLLMMEHPHVYTIGAHGKLSNILVPRDELGSPLVRTDRGGDITYHGPGQLVIYPILSATGPGAGPAHVRRIEQYIISILHDLGLDATAIDGYPGVWIESGNSPRNSPRKICSIGVRVSRGRTMHGLALNATTDLSYFDRIVPCGINGAVMTSLAKEGIRVKMSDVLELAVAHARELHPGCISMVDFAAISDTHTHSLAGRRADTPQQPIATSQQSTDNPQQQPTDTTQQSTDTTAAAIIPRSKAERMRIPVQRKPEWLRPQMRMDRGFHATRKTIRDLKLVTVCEEAGCPNIFECYANSTATFMINGERCTRNCGFCLIDTSKPRPLDPGEPDRIAQAVRRMGLAHAVITTVARDDLGDGGSHALASTVQRIRDVSPGTTVELLISDCKGDASSLDTIFNTRPDVLNHNIETVAGLQRSVRPQAGYARSLAVLARAAQARLTVKSGIMVGLGETEDELIQAMYDLRSVGTQILTVGQYLRPSPDKLPVQRWWTPDEFSRLESIAKEIGFSYVQASPLTRSSYHARAAMKTLSPVQPYMSHIQIGR